MSNMYLVETYGGQWEEYWETPHFVTEDKEYADKWCEKYMRILQAYRELAQQKYEDNHDWWGKMITLQEIIGVRITKIEKR